MSEQINPERSTGMAIMPPEKIATSNLAREMAGQIALDAVGSEGITEEKLNTIFSTEYVLRRNELEHIAGHKDPFAEKEIQSGQIKHEGSD